MPEKYIACQFVKRNRMDKNKFIQDMFTLTGWTFQNPEFVLYLNWINIYIYFAFFGLFYAP